jgi:hypothetical protein
MADARQTWRSATDAASPVNRAFAAQPRGDAGFANGIVDGWIGHVPSSCRRSARFAEERIGHPRTSAG